MKDNIELDKFLGYIVHHSDKAKNKLLATISGNWFEKKIQQGAIHGFYPLFVKAVELVSNELGIKVASAKESDEVEALSFREGIKFMNANSLSLARAMDEAYEGNWLTEHASDIAIYTGMTVVLKLLDKLAN